MEQPGHWGAAAVTAITLSDVTTGNAFVYHGIGEGFGLQQLSHPEHVLAAALFFTPAGIADDGLRAGKRMTRMNGSKVSRPRIIEAPIRGADVPYNPRSIRESLEASHPGRVTSTTTPPMNPRNNVHLAGTRHPSGTVFDQRGLPIFDDIAAADLRLSSAHVAGANYTGQMRAATRSLRRMIDAGDVSSSGFNAAQLRAIRGGRAQIPDFTWHHHQDIGRMQLVPRGRHGEVVILVDLKCGMDDES